MTSGDTIYASEHEQQQQQQQHQTSEQEQHDRFISALERYGPQTTGWEWENMATATGWTVDEVRASFIHSGNSLKSFYFSFLVPYSQIFQFP
mmetsp:Transcript_35839/g.47452  ORF Transcript_35839/g.47452 Transcript_35839/m.47452 type:complete len:92 (-) Transcript_35839:437-712(-)